MRSSIAHVAVLGTQACPAAQTSLINYINTLNRLDPAPFSRDAFDPANMPEKALRGIQTGQLSIFDGYFLSAAGLVARAVRNERLLWAALGQEWRRDLRFVPAVRQELAELRGAVRPAHEELKAWRKVLKGYNFGGYEDSSRTFDIREEEPLKGLLLGLQAVFLEKTTNAREIVASYGERSLAGVEDYFQVSPRRRSGPVPVLVAT